MVISGSKGTFTFQVIKQVIRLGHTCALVLRGTLPCSTVTPDSRTTVAPSGSGFMAPFP
jgi:hypothetical protein